MAQQRSKRKPTFPVRVCVSLCACVSFLFVRICCTISVRRLNSCQLHISNRRWRCCRDSQRRKSRSLRCWQCRMCLSVQDTVCTALAPLLICTSQTRKPYTWSLDSQRNKSTHFEQRCQLDSMNRWDTRWACWCRLGSSGLLDTGPCMSRSLALMLHHNTLHTHATYQTQTVNTKRKREMDNNKQQQTNEQQQRESKQKNKKPKKGDINTENKTRPLTWFARQTIRRFEAFLVLSSRAMQHRTSRANAVDRPQNVVVVHIRAACCVVSTTDQPV